MPPKTVRGESILSGTIFKPFWMPKRESRSRQQPGAGSQTVNAAN